MESKGGLHDNQYFISMETKASLEQGVGQEQVCRHRPARPFYAAVVELLSGTVGGKCVKVPQAFLFLGGRMEGMASVLAFFL